MRSLAVALALAGCGAGRSVLTTDELPAGSCKTIKLEPGESCRPGADDYSVGATVSVPKGHTDQVGGNVWFRWPLFDAGLDERHMRKDGRSYRSLAGTIGTHLRPLALRPKIQRYVDVVVNLGFELGALYDDDEARIKGRGAAYIGGAIDLFAPDLGTFHYLCCGVPGLRVGMRYSAYVQGWDSDTTFEVGLIWRWGVPIDLHTHWTWQRGGD